MNLLETKIVILFFVIFDIFIVYDLFIYTTNWNNPLSLYPVRRKQVSNGLPDKEKNRFIILNNLKSYFNLFIYVNFQNWGRLENLFNHVIPEIEDVDLTIMIVTHGGRVRSYCEIYLGQHWLR